MDRSDCFILGGLGGDALVGDAIVSWRGSSRSIVSIYHSLSATFLPYSCIVMRSMSRPRDRLVIVDKMTSIFST